MKTSKFVGKLVAMVAIFALCVCSVDAQAQTRTRKTATTKSTTSALTLTKAGIGTIKIGMKKTALPSSVSGMYDKLSYYTINHDTDMDCPLNIKGFYRGTLNGKSSIAIYIDDKNTVCGVQVCVKGIKDSNGVYVGMTEAKLKKALNNNYDINVLTCGYCSGVFEYRIDESTVSSLCVGWVY